MKRTRIILSLLSVIVLFLLGFNFYTTYTFDFTKVRQGELIKNETKESPNKDYISKVYQIPTGGAAGETMVRVEIESLKTGQAKTIYYASGNSFFSIQWLNNEEILITNKSRINKVDLSMILNVNAEIFDEKGKACKSLIMKDDYKKCYQLEDAPKTSSRTN